MTNVFLSPLTRHHCFWAAYLLGKKIPPWWLRGSCGCTVDGWIHPVWTEESVPSYKPTLPLVEAIPATALPLMGPDWVRQTRAWHADCETHGAAVTNPGGSQAKCQGCETRGCVWVCISVCVCISVFGLKWEVFVCVCAFIHLGVGPCIR